MVAGWIESVFCQGKAAVNAGHVGLVYGDVVNVSRAIGCGWQELACIRCVLQTSPAQQPITLPSYRNCHSHWITDLLTWNWHSGKWRAYYLMRHGLQTHPPVDLWVSDWFVMEWLQVLEEGTSDLTVKRAPFTQSTNYTYFFLFVRQDWGSGL